MIRSEIVNTTINMKIAMIQVMMVALLSASYQVSSPHSKIETCTNAGTIKSSSVISLQREWSDKAIKNYAEAQDKKWRRWREAMFR